MMKWWKTLVMTAALITTAGSLAACGHEKKNANGKIEIEFFNQKKEMSGTLTKIAKNFEKENPNIKVNVVSVPDAGNVLKTRVLAGDIPDVVNIFPQNIDFQEWAKAGYFADMTDQDYLHNLKDGYPEQFAINGKVYNAPLTSNSYGFYYNATVFEELGLTPPKTWTEFEQLKQEIIAKGKIPFALAGTEGWTLNGYHQLAWATVTGGFKQANAVLRFSKPNYLTLDNPDMQRDIRRLDLLRGKGAAQKNWEGAGYNDAITAFANGTSLMMANGSWALAAVKQQEPSFKIRTFAFPGDKPGESMAVGSADLALSIAEDIDDAHKAAANKFVAYMTTKEAMQPYYDVDGSPCAVKGVEQEGKIPELEGITSLTFTEHQMIWLQKEWLSENDFHQLTADYILDGNKKALVENLNAFFNPMKADVKDQEE